MGGVDNLEELNWQLCLSYLDDLEEALKDMREAFDELEKNCRELREHLDG